MVAGILKLHEYLTVSPFAPSTGIIPHRWLFAVAIFELVLALHLLLQDANPWPWIFGVLLFGVFTAFNIVMIVRGQPTCECFGRFSMSPWVGVGIDGLSLASLLTFLPGGSWRAAIVRSFGSLDRRWVYFSALAVALTAILWLTLPGRTIIHWWTVTNSVVARVEPTTIVASPKQHVDLQVVIENNRDEAVMLIGKQGTCGIQTNQSFPLTILAHNHVTINAFVHVAAKGEKYLVPFVVVTDCNEFPIVSSTAVVEVR